ncbi:MAG: hypothetical protein AAGK97_18070 [Bacteroidota bacterium]
MSLGTILSPNYRLIVDKKGSMDRVKIEVETSSALDINNASICTNLSFKIKENIGLSISVEVKKPNTIPRSQGGKLSRILDLR